MAIVVGAGNRFCPRGKPKAWASRRSLLRRHPEHVGMMPTLQIYSRGMRAVFGHADDSLAPMYAAHAAGLHNP
jgi:hypothetical protein